MSAFHNNALLGASGQQGYTISRSVRLRSSASAYFNRTLGSGSTTAWTWSGWVKRGYLGANQTSLFFGDSSTTNYGGLYITNDNLSFQNRPSAGSNALLVSTQVLRDPSAWYHIVAVWDSNNATSTDRVRLYVNGTRITALSTATYPSSGTASVINTAIAHEVGAYVAAGGAYGGGFDGYLTEINFIDGQALTPSSFGENDTVTGVWKPKKYAGTYGTNGFYLNFSDNSAATAAAIGKDYSGNGNNWTPNNISVTSGATYDSMLDVPTLYGDGGNGRGNYATLNPLDANSGMSPINGNLDVTASTAAWKSIKSTMFLASGKWYWEAIPTVLGNEEYSIFGLAVQSESNNNYVGQSGSANVASIQFNASVSTASLYGSGRYATSISSVDLSANQVVMFAYDADAGKLWIGKDGTWFNSGAPASGTGACFTGLPTLMAPTFSVYNSGNTIALNAGQRPFAYTPPTGFKALNTQNLPEPTIKKGNQYFDAVARTGTGATYTQSSLPFDPDFVWIKRRVDSGYGHMLFDKVRGVTNYLNTNNTNAEAAGATTLTAFGTGGYTLGSDVYVNESTKTYIDWNWKEGATQGFDIVTFTNPSSGSSSFAHNLGVKPSMIITKARSGTGNWTVTHKSLGANMQDYYLLLNGTAASTTSAGIWGGEPTSSVFYSSAALQVPSATIVAYLFSEVAGFSKFGSYTGNGSADGPFVYCGFRPRFVLIKRSDAGAESWWILDTSRDPYNTLGNALFPNISGAESAGYTFDFLSNGFKLRTYINTSGGTYIYAAFAENPFKYALAR